MTPHYSLPGDHQSGRQPSGSGIVREKGVSVDARTQAGQPAEPVIAEAISRDCAPIAADVK